MSRRIRARLIVSGACPLRPAERPPAWPSNFIRSALPYRTCPPPWNDRPRPSTRVHDRVRPSTTVYDYLRPSTMKLECESLPQLKKVAGRTTCTHISLGIRKLCRPGKSVLKERSERNTATGRELKERLRCPVCSCSPLSKYSRPMRGEELRIEPSPSGSLLVFADPSVWKGPKKRAIQRRRR